MYEMLGLELENEVRNKPTLRSPLPPADWMDPAMDDSAWPRVRLPQPVLPYTPVFSMTVPCRTFPYETVVALLRGKFKVGNPAPPHPLSAALLFGHRITSFRSQFLSVKLIAAFKKRGKTARAFSLTSS